MPQRVGSWKHLASGAIASLLLLAAAGGCARHSAGTRAQLATLDARVSALESRQPAAMPSSWDDLAGEDLGAGDPAPARSPTAAEPAAIQRALKRAGYYDGRVDGAIGPQTKRAIRAFQRAHGLRPDGIVGEKTWARLQRYATTP